MRLRLVLCAPDANRFVFERAEASRERAQFDFSTPASHAFGPRSKTNGTIRRLNIGGILVFCVQVAVVCVSGCTSSRDWDAASVAEVPAAAESVDVAETLAATESAEAPTVVEPAEVAEVSTVDASVGVTEQLPTITPSVAEAAAILARADEVRNPQLDYVTTVTITSIQLGRDPRVAEYEVFVKGRDLTVIKTIKPENERGRGMLMNGLDMWAFLPTVSKPLRISLRERLIGEVANGDLARTNFSGDYVPEIVATELLDGRAYDKLDLKARSMEVTYARVMLWVDTENAHPLKAEFYAPSGRLLKSCRYERYQELAGRLRPTRFVMVDPLRQGQESILEYSYMEVRELPEKYFTKQYMRKLLE